MKLTQESVRLAMLAAQGLLSPPAAPPTKDDLLPIIREMGYLQIDTIHAVRRSHHLVLWSRLGDIEPDWIFQIQAEGKLFEYYAHALCYLPIEDYPIFRSMILYDDRTGNDWKKWADENQDIVEKVRTVLMEKGPMCSADFESERIFSGWGSIKAEKLALSRMFSTGEVMVPFRKKFQRYYDFRERVLPDWDDTDLPDVETARKALLLRTVSALGVARQDWAATYYYFKKTGIPEVLSYLVAEGQLHLEEVEGWELPVYIHPDRMNLVKAAVQGKLKPQHTTLLSPFDPLVSDRERTHDVFNFDYTMESFLPAKDRKYGYFCLPILHQGKLVGRLDPKAHRKQKKLEIKKIYLEPGVALDDDLVDALRDTLTAFTAWHELETLEITDADPPELIKALQ
jgi:uncharacterized protein YcaQ